jgi:lipopolysaccharide biosynthesis protein
MIANNTRTMNDMDHNSPYLYFDFQKIWRVFPIPRSTKELVKSILFELFPFAFRRFAIYQNWLNAKAFHYQAFKPWRFSYWKYTLCRGYYIKHPDITTAIPHNDNIPSIAVVVHVYYCDVFSEIMERIRNFKEVPLTLYITTQQHLINDVKQLIPNTIKNVVIEAVPNHGRDIWPFLQIMLRVKADGHTVVLKLHTKKSNHLHRKLQWRTAIFDELTGEEKMKHALATFHDDPQVGMIAPLNNILSMHLHYGANGAKVHEIARRLGLSDHQLRAMPFIAGSMFWANTKVLAPIIDLQLTAEDFEPEAEQVDGTMAHVIERVFTLGLTLTSMKLLDTDYTSGANGYKVSKNHRFTG